VTNIRFFQGANRNQELLDFAQQLRKQYKIALLTNIGSDMMDGFFTKAERARFFDSAVLSGEVKMAKPDSKIFELIM
jgi:FMN phosphatase YigB (HAD superfamily)